MPTIASKPISAAVRRARRRERRMQTRARSLAKLPQNSPPAVRRRTLRRQNRDQASFGLETCFNICQDTGYHQDPDVRIGSEATQVNHFAVLDADASVPALRRPTKAEFTFSFPSTRQGDDDLIAARACIDDATEYEQRATSQARLVLKKLPSWSPSQTEAVDSTSTPLLPSIPTTPPARARVKLPFAFSTSRRESPTSTYQAPVKDYFDGIRIPSPLLYHRRSREQLLTQSFEADIESELTKEFVLNCGQDVPKPDFECYKVIHETPKQTAPPPYTGPSSSIVPPLVNNLLKTQKYLKFGKNLHPQWTVQLYQPSVHRWVQTARESSMEPASNRLSKASTTLPILTTTNIFSIAQLGIPCAQTCEPYRHSDSDAVAQVARYDLVFPKLPTPPPCIVVDTRCRSSRRKVITELIDDDPGEVRKRWQAFEDAVSPPRHRVSPSEDVTFTLPTASQSLSFSPGKPVSQPWFAFTPCSTSNCVALLPTRLHRDRDADWPQSPDHSRNLDQSQSPIVQPIATQDLEDDDTFTLAEWINDLGFEREHTEDCPVAHKSGASSGFGLEDLFQTRSLTPLSGPMDAGVAMIQPLRSSSTNFEVLVSEVSNPDFETMDEGYFTGESTVQVEQDDAIASEDEWVEWD